MADVTPSPQPPRPAEPANLAEHRARKIDPAELAELTRRLEAVEAEAGGLRATIAIHEARNARIAVILGEAADATRGAREELDREIEARHAAEAALLAERIGREGAERALQAERAAREAARHALNGERLRTLEAEALAPAVPIAIPLPPQGFPAVPTVPAPAVAAHETDELVAGLARAAERLRAQAPPVPEAPPQQAVAPPAPVVAASVPAPPVVVHSTRSGGLIGALDRLLRGRP